MLKSLRNLAPGARGHRVWPVLLVTIGLLAATLAGPANAIEVTTLYTAQVPLDPEEDNPRQAAYGAALAEVLLRVSGSALSADAGMIELLFPSPAAYVVQFRPGPDDTLWVSFDGEAVEQTLRAAGQSVWGTDRPLTLVWLAVDWGQGEREIIGADDPERSLDEARSIDRNRLLRQRVLDVAERRGLPIVFLLLDTDDLESVSFSDICGGFDEQLLAASQRYDASSVLAGCIRPLSSQRNRWSYFFGSDERTYNGEPELVVSLVADVLAAEFSISGAAPPETIDLTIAGIESVAAYGAVQKMLSDLTVIESIAIAEVRGDQVLYRVEAHGGAERLRRALRFSGLIEQNALDTDPMSIDTFNPSLEFFFSAE